MEFLTIGNPCSDGRIIEWLEGERDNVGVSSRDNEVSSSREMVCTKV